MFSVRNRRVECMVQFWREAALIPFSRIGRAGASIRRGASGAGLGVGLSCLRIVFVLDRAWT